MAALDHPHVVGVMDFGSAALDWRIAKGVKLELDAEYQERSQITVPGFQLLDGTTGE